MDTGPESGFDRLTSLASDLLAAPVALVSLVDDRRQYFKSCVGLPEPWSTRRQTPLTHSFCRLAVIEDAPLIVTDAETDDRVRDNLAVRDLSVRAYLGVPIRDRHGEALGSFCVIDAEAREWTEDDLQRIRSLRDCVETEIELRSMVGASRRRAEKMERRVKAMKRRADESDLVSTRKSLFLAKLSHELRTPLTPIAAAAELLAAEAMGDAERREIAAIVGEQVRQLRRLVDDMRELSRIEQGTLELTRERVDVSQVLRGAVRTCREMAEGRNHSLTVAAGEGVVVEGDGDRLLQVFCNLLSNACRYTPPGGRIEAAARTEGGEAVVSVTDTGVGLRPEVLGSIFGTFRQSGGETPSEREGLGLGLAIVRQLTRLHGGEVRAFSDGPGCGSTFEVRLPALRDPAAAAPEAAAPAAVAPLDIVVVDDAPAVTFTVSKLLGRDDHTVRTAASAAEAERLVAERRPDILFSDIEMPGRSGLELARGLRAASRTRTLPLVALTGRVAEGDAQDVLDAGFDRHLAKPVSLDELRATLDSLFG